MMTSQQINVRTLWKEIFPLIKDDPRYIASVGLPDSTPLDMFWDAIDDLDEQLYHQKKAVYNALKKADLEVTLETPYEDYLNALDIDPQVKVEVNETNLKFIYEHLQSKAAQRLKDEKRRQEKKLRKRLDIFRHALKHALQPPIGLEDTWETVKPRVEQMEEYLAVEDETLKQEVFDKYMKRLRVSPCRIT
jgi:pre-mRNA-processing factor 40